MAIHDFSGKRILVTGAGKGIGRETVQWLSRCGAEVIALGRNAADLAYCDQTLVVDLADVAATRAAVTSALPIDLLVNCAGVVELESFLETSVQTFDHLMAVNTRAPMLVAQVVARDLIGRGVPGAIVNVSSLAAAVGTRDHLAYCASKAAALMLTRSADKEYFDEGIRVVGLSPGTVATDMQVRIKASGINPVSQLDPAVHIPADWPARAIAWLCTQEAAEFHGVDVSLRDEDIRRRAGLI